MGQRAIVVFKDRYNTSPGVYLHWNGDNVVDWLKEAGPMLRAGDAGYAVARFCGFCHERIEPPLSLGIIASPLSTQENDLEAYSHGDNGVFVVDVDTGEVRNHADPWNEARPFRIDLAHR